MADIHYSVGQNTSTDLKNDTPTCTISSGTLTFSVAQTGNIGVGCKITYDTSKTCYISGKTSQTVWSVVTVTGGTPTNEASPVTVNSIKHVFSSLNSAMANVEGASYTNSTDWVTDQYNVFVHTYRQTGDDTTAVVFPDGITCNASYHLNIQTPTDTLSECNTDNWISDKKWTPGGYVLSVDDVDPINMDGGSPELTFAEIHRLQIELGGNTTASCGISGYDNDNCWVDKCIIRQKSGATAQHEGIGIRFVSDLLVSNIIIYGFDNDRGLDLDSQGNNADNRYTNISVYGCDEGVYTGSANVYQSGILDNIIVSGNTTYDWDNSPYVSWTSGTGNRCENNIDGGNNVNSMNNSANNQVNKSATDIWVDPANGDFNLKAGSPAINQGRTESGFSDDIGGTVRPKGSAWDAGAIEYSNALLRRRREGY